jgi:hypothetical protein
MGLQERQRPDPEPFVLGIHIFAGGVASAHLIFPWPILRRLIFEGVALCTVRYASDRELKSTWKTLRNLR